jgi:hypothetical protein
MKTLSLLSFIAAFVALVASPLSLEVTGSLVFGAGLLCIMVGDYARPVRSLTPRAGVVRFPRAAKAAPALGLAA